MKIRFVTLAAVFLTLVTGALKPSAFASSETETYQLHMEAPQIAQAANGDVVSISGSGVFQVNTETPSNQQFYAVLWVFCIIGPNPPNSHDDPTGEGVNLDIIGVNNFNRIVSGGNVFIKTS